MTILIKCNVIGSLLMQKTFNDGKMLAPVAQVAPFQEKSTRLIAMTLLLSTLLIGLPKVTTIVAILASGPFPLPLCHAE
jgi:hypothetical protein